LIYIFGSIIYKVIFDNILLLTAQNSVSVVSLFSTCICHFVIDLSTYLFCKNI